jgi:hypothetical protein
MRLSSFGSVCRCSARKNVARLVKTEHFTRILRAAFMTQTRHSIPSPPLGPSIGATFASSKIGYTLINHAPGMAIDGATDMVLGERDVMHRRDIRGRPALASDGISQAKKGWGL